MNKKQFIELIGKDVEIDYLFGKEVQQWNMKNFYIDENGEIKHKRLSLIMDKFISRCVYPSIVDLIEKATPKKPIKDGSGYIHCDKVQYICPHCNDIMLRVICVKAHKPNYCYKCGGALDWGEEND